MPSSLFVDSRMSYRRTLSLLSLSAVISFLLVVLLSQCVAASAQAAPTSMSQVVITSVTGCTDVFPITVNCTMPANLTIRTAGLGSLWTGDYYTHFLQLTAAGGENRYVTVNLDTTDSTNSTLWAAVTTPVYSPQWVSGVVNVSLYFSSSADLQSPQYPGFTFAQEDVPVIDSISGCIGSGTATLNCAPDTAVLTVRGSGIGWLSSYSARLRIGDNVAPTTLRTVNASYGTISLARIYYSLLFPEHYNGVVLPLHFEWTYLFNGSRIVHSTNQLSISFVPLPPPYLSYAQVTSCTTRRSSDVQANYTDCRPGSSVLYVSGHYLYNASVSIGSVPCVLTYGDADYISCSPPVAAGLQTNLPYSVSVVNSQGGFTIPDFLAFSVKPSVAYIENCVASLSYSQLPTVYNSYTARCLPGAVITIHGSQLHAGDEVQVLFTLYSPTTSSGIAAFNMSCLNAAVVDDGTVKCELPAVNTTLASMVYGRYAYLQVAFNASTVPVWTNTIYNVLYQDPAAPRITGVSAIGCGATTTAAYFPGSPLQLSDCTSNATITLTGVNLDANTCIAQGVLYSVLNAYSGITATLLSNSSTQVVVQLPDVADELTAVMTGTSYQFVLQLWRTVGYQQSNVFLVSYATPPNPSSRSSSSSKLSSGAIAGIVVAAVVVVVVCVLLVAVLLRRRSSFKSGGTAGSSEDGFGSSLRPTRLQEESSRNNAGRIGVELH